VNNAVFLGVAAALNWLNTVLWLVFWLELTGRYWQGALAITGFGLVAALCCFLLYREHRHRARRRSSSFLPILLMAFGFLWLVLLMAGPGG
jgi:hypothetical protein